MSPGIGPSAYLEADVHTCPYCDEPMANPRRKQCGKPACKRAFNAERMRDYQRRYKEKHGHYQTRLYDRLRTKRHGITCAYCGRQAVVTKPTARYCASRCWYDAKHAAHAQIEPAWKPHLVSPRAVSVTVIRPLRRRWYGGQCPMCMTWFVTDNPKHQYCTPRCGRRAAKDSRRARQREAFVAPVSRIQVYERDRWTCRLCGKRVARSKVVPHPKAPTLDHVIPLAKGGTHEPANVQLAHYECNMRKSDGVAACGEQLALIG